MNLYSVKDNKVGIYQRPFVSVNDAEASRELHRAVQDNTLQLSMYAEDFDLYYIGKIDDNSGKITQKETEPRFVVGAISFKKIVETEGKK